MDLLMPRAVVGGVGHNEVVGLQAGHEDVPLDEDLVMGIQGGPSKHKLGKWEGNEQAREGDRRRERRGKHGIALP